MTNGIGHRVIAISRIFLNDQWKFLPWWLLSKSEYNELLSTQNVNVARFARNVECDFFEIFSTTVGLSGVRLLAILQQKLTL